MVDKLSSIFLKKEGSKMVDIAWYWWAAIAAVIGYLVYYFWNN